MSKKLIFIVGSDASLQQLLRLNLEMYGFELVKSSPENLVRDVESREPALVLIDREAQQPRQLELCRRIRRGINAAKTRVVFLTEVSIAEDRLLCFNAGADDCITKPFVSAELVARVRSVLRLNSRHTLLEMEPESVLKVGEVEINTRSMTVSVGGDPINTTALEFRLMVYLARNQGRVFSRDQLLDAAWGNSRFVNPRAVDTCIRRLRRKVHHGQRGTTYLRTIRGVGYCLDPVRSLPRASEIPYEINSE